MEVLPMEPPACGRCQDHTMTTEVSGICGAELEKGKPLEPRRSNGHTEPFTWALL